MSRNHWREYHRAWARLTSPLRPNDEVVAAARALIAGLPGRVLLLGITPELAGISRNIFAVDQNHSIVCHVWPGNTGMRRVLVSNWLKPPFADASFSACIGDGSFSSLKFPEEYTALCCVLAELVRSGGRVVCRVYAAPDNPESISSVRKAALSGEIENFHAFKLRLAMALAAERGESNIAVESILMTFNEMFGDREKITRAAGWDREHVDTVDFYNGSSVRYSFPTRSQLLSVIPTAFSNMCFVSSGTYELADRCPLLVMEKT